jgi:NADPH:quinone reductase
VRAIVVQEFGPLDNAVLGNVPDPVPGGDDVLIEVHGVAVNFVDTLMIAGTYQFRPPLPFVPGKLPVGTVTAIGGNVNTMKTGDRVMALVEQGGFAERVLVKPTLCIPVPAPVSFIDAAAMSSVFDTAWFALHERAGLKPGETVLVVGASGGVGLAALQLAKTFGARTLAAIANPAKADLVQTAGADVLIDLSRDDLIDGLREQVREATQGRGADVVLDMLGGDMFDAAIRALAWGGRLVVIGFAAGRIATLKTNYLLLKNIAVSGLQISDYRRLAPRQTRACWADLFALCEAHRLTPLPTTVMPIARAGEALRALKERTARCRIVLSPDRDSP